MSFLILLILRKTQTSMTEILIFRYEISVFILISVVETSCSGFEKINLILYMQEVFSTSIFKVIIHNLERYFYKTF